MRDPVGTSPYDRDMRTPEAQLPTRLEDREEEQDLDLIVERLAWTPAERLRHLLEMLAFEQRARAARSLGALIGPRDKLPR